MRNSLIVFLAAAALLFMSPSWGMIAYSGKLFSLKKISEMPAAITETNDYGARIPVRGYSSETVWNSILFAFQRDRHWTASPDTARQVGILDIDGDGKDEIVILTADGELSTYSIDGRTTEIKEITRTEFFISSKYFADIYPMTFKNKISLSDVLSDGKTAGTGDKLKFIFNDLDGDGKPDMIVNAGAAYVFMNRYGIFIRTAAFDRLIHPYFADINGDGRKDIVFQKDSRSVNLYLSGPDGSYRASVFPKTDNIFQAIGSPDFRAFAARIDRASGEPQLIFVTKPFLGDGDMIVHRYDKKNNTFIPYRTIANIPFYIAFLDIDGDGIDEFYNRFGPADVYIDSLTATKANFNPKEADGLSYFIWEDFNNDKLLDFVLVNSAGMFRSSYFYLRKGDTFVEQYLPKVLVESPALGTDEGSTNLLKYTPTNYSLIDIDGDGLKDLVTWNRNSLNVYKNTGGGFVSFFDAPAGDPNEVFVDLNGDGKLDYFNAGSPGFGLWIDTGTSMEKAVLDPDVPAKNILFFDADGDGKKELFVLGGGGPFFQTGVYVYKDKGHFHFEEIKDEFVALDHLAVQFLDGNIVDVPDGMILIHNNGK